METLVERIRALCKQRKIPISKLEKDLGFGNGFLNPKKIKTIPADRLLEILNYIGISYEEFDNIGSEKNQKIQTAFTTLKKADNGVYNDVMEAYLQKTTEEQSEATKMLFQILRGATEEEILQAVKIIEALKKE